LGIAARIADSVSTFVAEALEAPEIGAVAAAVAGLSLAKTLIDFKRM